MKYIKGCFIRLSQSVYKNVQELGSKIAKYIFRIFINYENAQVYLLAQHVLKTYKFNSQAKHYHLCEIPILELETNL